MYTTTVKTKSQDKARRSFNYQCHLASNCRYEKYMVSCHSCPNESTCYIQKAIEIARKKM
jgi:hypothetical protein